MSFPQSPTHHGKHGWSCVMIWFFGLAAAAVLMSLSEKAWGNPLTIFGVIPVGLCFAMLGSAFLKAVGLN